MKTLEQIIKDYKDNTLDGRQSYRFAQFLTFDKLAEFGFELKDGIHIQIIDQVVHPDILSCGIQILYNRQVSGVSNHKTHHKYYV